MEETEKMTALKKAYAEIILNTAKEAAARIMVSERKAHQLNHDLTCTKDEAFRLLLRLKQSMDFKINEAEVKSLDQQRRIEELEAQLQEAEDVVFSLRAELTEAHTKLEEIAEAQLYSQPNFVERAVYEDENSERANRPVEAVSVSAAEQISYSANGHSVANSALENYGYSGEPDVPSIIVRNQKPKLNRNGCTQRIRACEGNILRGHLSQTGGEDHLKNVEAPIQNNLADKICLTAPTVADITCVEKEKPVDLKEVKDEDNLSLIQPLKSFRTRRKTACRHRKSTASGIMRVSKDALSAPSNSHVRLPCFHGMHESDNEDTSGQSSSPSSAPSVVSKMGALTLLLGSQSELSDGREVDVNEDKEVASNSVVSAKESSSADILDTLGLQSELETKNLSAVNLDVKQLKACDGLPSAPPKDRVLKYTFQRKRKKESVACDDRSSAHLEYPRKRKKSNKQIGSLEPQNSSIVADSSRDSRRVAQLAHQLVSLSENKCW